MQQYTEEEVENKEVKNFLESAANNSGIGVDLGFLIDEAPWSFSLRQMLLLPRKTTFLNSSPRVAKYDGPFV